MSQEHTFVVRQLGPGDAGELREMLAVFGDVFDEPETYCGAQPGTEYLERLLGSAHFIAVAASDGGRIVGALTAYELQKYEQERSELYIYDLAVAPEHRRRGIATALIGKVKHVAAERGAWVVYVQADVGDEPAIALYTKLGVREDVLHFDIAPG